MLFGIIIIVHVIVCLLLILLVLVQSDKGGGLAGAFGGMSGGVNSVFGGRGTANILTKATTWAAVLFLSISLILNLVVANKSTSQVKSVLQKRAERMSRMAPASALPKRIKDPSKIQNSSLLYIAEVVELGRHVRLRGA